MSKETLTPTDLKATQEIIITKQGSEMKSNDWEEGGVVSVHPNLAADFIKRGIAKEKK